MVAEDGRKGSGGGNNDSIAVIGMSCRVPGANDVDAFWQILCEGKSTLSTPPRTRLGDNSFGKKWPTRTGGFLEDIEHFDGDFFRISSAEAKVLDPQQAIFLEEAWHALEDAAIPGFSLRDTQAGIFVGVWSEDFTALLVRLSSLFLHCHFDFTHMIVLIPISACTSRRDTFTIRRLWRSCFDGKRATCICVGLSWPSTDG